MSFTVANTSRRPFITTLIVRTILVPALAYDIGGKIWWPSKLASK